MMSDDGMTPVMVVMLVDVMVMMVLCCYCCDDIVTLYIDDQ